MKTTTVMSSIIVAIVSANNAFAASSLSEDNSGLFVWFFLGFCALIVVAQVMPAVLLMTGIIKGVTSRVSEPAKASVKS